MGDFDNLACKSKYATIKDGSVKIDWDSKQHQLLHAQNLPHSHVCITSDMKKHIVRSNVESKRSNVKFEQIGPSLWNIEAIHVIITGNNRKYTKEELQVAARSLSYRPININHDESLWLPFNGYRPYAEDSNSILDMDFDPAKLSVSGQIQVVDAEVNEMIANGEITSLSIEQVPQSETTECSISGCVHEQHGIVFTGIALLTSDVLPGDSKTRISKESKYDDKLEKLRKKWGWKKESQIEADYPWDQCMADQMRQYGDEETARKVCGAIKAQYGESKNWYKEDQAMNDCMSEMHSAHPDMKPDQMVAICMSKLGRSENKECGCIYSELQKLESLL
ncbi:MAG: hypothetical protein DA330_09835 [Nitrososphaera sp.]|nr:hypothetical protein [Nitrososphaera sp.]